MVFLVYRPIRAASEILIRRQCLCSLPHPDRLPTDQAKAVVLAFCGKSTIHEKETISLDDVAYTFVCKVDASWKFHTKGKGYDEHKEGARDNQTEENNILLSDKHEGWNTMNLLGIDQIALFVT